MSHHPHDDGGFHLHAADPDPRPGPALTGRQAARVGISAACREVAEVAASRVPTTDDAHTAPGDWIAYSTRLRRMVIEVFFRAITMERMNGTPWEAIARQLHMTPDEIRHEAGHADLTHHAGDGQAVWDVLAQTCLNPIPGACAATPEEAAAELDEWYRRWQQPDDHPTQPPARAVTANL